MRADSQTFRYVCERDIDLLLLEEITVSPGFRHWFLEEFSVNLGRERKFIDAWHSVSDSELGESDLEFGVILENGKKLLVMIENKINAPFQDNQLRRYQLRGEKALSDGWDDFLTSLVAPEGYSRRRSTGNKVDTHVTYEAIQEWFAKRDSPRSTFKARMLDDAIKQKRRGSNSQPDDQVTQLHQHYWNIACERFPDLPMDEPKGVPAGNLWIRFKIPSLPDDVKLRHKMGKGHVDLEFRGAVEKVEEFEERYAPNLEDGAQIVSTSASVIVRKQAPKISADEPPREQEDNMRKGLETARELLNWYQQMSHGSS